MLQCLRQLHGRDFIGFVFALQIARFDGVGGAGKQLLNFLQFAHGIGFVRAVAGTYLRYAGSLTRAKQTE